MASPLKSLRSSPEQTADSGPRGWLGLGILAAASAVAGGIAAAWYYRKTLIRLRQAEAHTSYFADAPQCEDPEDDV